MNKLKIILLAGATLTAFGCATAPAPVYITEAQQVTTLALEPVNLVADELANDITKKWSKQLPADSVDTIMMSVKQQIANTKRFSKVIDNSIDGKSYTIKPRIMSLSSYETPMPTDPNRKQLTFKATVQLDVEFMNQKGQVQHVKSFTDKRTLDKKVSSKFPVPPEKKAELYNELIDVAFTAAANMLGYAFNPSYEMGKVTSLNGKSVNIMIATSKIKVMPKGQLESNDGFVVIDDDNKVLASISELVIGDGSVTGKVYPRGGASIKEGAKVRVRVNSLQE